MQYRSTFLKLILAILDNANIYFFFLLQSKIKERQKTGKQGEKTTRLLTRIVSSSCDKLQKVQEIFQGEA
jgi:hypothetical protein